MRDHERMLRLCRRRPRPHACRRAGLRQVNGRVATEVMLAAVRRHRLFVRSPAEFRRLQPFGAKALDRPGIDEHGARLRIARALGVALGDVDAFDAGAMHQPRPLVARLGLLEGQAELGGDVKQRLLDEPRHHAGIGAAAAHGGDAARPPPPQVQQAFPQRVIRSLRDRQIAVGVEPGPRLDHGVDVEGVNVLRERHQLDRGGIDRKIDDHAAPRPRDEERSEQVAVVLLGDCRMDETQLAVVEQAAIFVIRRDHDEFAPVKADVPLDQRERSATDRAEADHDDRAVEAGVQGPGGGSLGHGVHVRRSQISNDSQAA